MLRSILCTTTLCSSLALPAAAQLSLVSNLPGTFIDISSTGTPLSLADDGEVSITTTLGNALLPAGEVRIGSNGGARFRGTGTNLAIENAPLPAFGAFSFESQSLLPFWDDLNSGSGTIGEIYWQEVGGQLIVQWKDVGFFGSPGTERVTFQLQVPTTGTVWARFLYVDVEQMRAAGGASATIGYQGGGYGSDIQFSFNTPNVVSNSTVLSLVGSFTPPPPPLANCLATPFNGGSGVSAGNTCFFDLTMTQAVSIGGIAQNYNALPGSPVGVEVYVTPGTYSGNELDINVWTLVGVDNGTATSAGEGLPSNLTFATPISLLTGTYGVAVVAIGSTQRYTIGNGMNQDFTSPDGVLALSAGSVTAVPFSGAVIAPRVWNGRLCYSGGQGPGVSYCGPAVTNSTGASAQMVTGGSASRLANNLVLGASNLPSGSFAFFLTSTTQGFVVGPGGSQGNLCLAGSIGRYVGPGQVQQAGAAGTIQLAIDLGQVPTPQGPTSASVGQTWNFQTWYRDANPTVTSNFSDGRAVTILP
jgi:hypothetical protein